MAVSCLLVTVKLITRFLKCLMQMITCLYVYSFDNKLFQSRGYINDFESTLA